MTETFKQARSRYLSGTYKPCKELQPRISIIRRWGTSRAKMVRWLTDNGGYSSRHQRYALEWNVSAHGADLDIDRAEHWVKEFWGEGYLDVEECNLEAFTQMVKRLHPEHANDMWAWGVEDAQRGVQESDCYNATFTGLGGLPVKYVFEGRGGKHLCMSEFRSINLCQSGDDLEYDLLEKDDDGDWVISHAHLIELFLLCVEAQVSFTSDIAGQEVERAAWWSLIVNIAECEWRNAQ